MRNASGLTTRRSSNSADPPPHLKLFRGLIGAKTTYSSGTQHGRSSTPKPPPPPGWTSSCSWTTSRPSRPKSCNRSQADCERCSSDKLKLLPGFCIAQQRRQPDVLLQSRAGLDSGLLPDRPGQENAVHAGRGRQGQLHRLPHAVSRLGAEQLPRREGAGGLLPLLRQSPRDADVGPAAVRHGRRPLLPRRPAGRGQHGRLPDDRASDDPAGAGQRERSDVGRRVDARGEQRPRAGVRPGQFAGQLVPARPALDAPVRRSERVPVGRARRPLPGPTAIASGPWAPRSSSRARP